ncbi:MAG: hypothetical protein ABIG10_01055 [bacterium]
MKTWFKLILVIWMLLAFNLPNASAYIFSRDTIEDMGKLSNDTANAYDASTNNNSMTQIMADVIKVFLGLLGIIFIVIIIVAGYNLLTAGGNDEKVEKARKLITRSIIGLIIILSAYAITYWIFARMPSGSPNFWQ